MFITPLEKLQLLLALWSFIDEVRLMKKFTRFFNGLQRSILSDATKEQNVLIT